VVVVVAIVEVVVVVEVVAVVEVEAVVDYNLLQSEKVDTKQHSLHEMA